MNNKIFKKKSSFYLFSALAFLLILACVGGFFIFNASAVNELNEGFIEINCSSRPQKGYIIYDNNDNGNEIFSKEGDTKALNISGTDGATLDFYIVFDDDHTGNVDYFGVEFSDGKIYNQDETKKQDYDNVTLETKETTTYKGKPARHFVIKLPKLDTTAVISDGQKAHHAKLNIKFNYSTVISTMDKLIFKSVSSNYGWTSVSNQFKVYDDGILNGKPAEICPTGKNGKQSETSFRVKQGTTSFSFYVEPSAEFKNSLETMNLSATHTSGNKSYNYPMIGLTNSNDDGKILVGDDKKEYVYRKIFKDKDNTKRIKYDTINQRMEVDEGNDRKTYEYKENMKVFIINDTEYVRDISSGSVIIDGVTYTFDENSKSFNSVVDGNSINFSQYRRVFTKVGDYTSKECYKYDTGNNLVAYQENMDDNAQAAEYKYELEKPEEGEFYVSSDGTEYIYSNQMLVKKDDKSSTVACAYRKVTLKLFNLDKNDNQIFGNGIQGNLNVDLKVENIFNNLTQRISVNKGVNSKSVDLTNTSNVEVRVAVPSAPSEEVPSYNENCMLEKTSDTGYRIVDVNETETVVSTRDANGKYAGAYGTIYTFGNSDNDNFKFIDSDGKGYDCNKKNKTFIGKDNVEYTFDPDKNELRYERYKDVSVPYDGSVYIYIAPTDTGWYSGSKLKVTFNGTELKQAGKMKVNGNELSCYKITGIKNGAAIAVDGFELKNLSFNVNFNGAPEGTGDRVTISVNKIKDNGETGEELISSNGIYSGIDPKGFVCKISAGKGDINWQDIDLEKFKYEFSDKSKINGGGELVIKYDNSDKRPYVEFKVTGLESDFTMNITSVPYKTIGVLFCNPGLDGNAVGDEINVEPNKKADIYLSGSTTSVTSFSSGQAWNFDFNFSDKYESDSSVDDNGKVNYELEASLYAWDGTDYDFVRDKKVVYQQNSNGRTFIFEFPGEIRGCEKVAIVFKNVIERKLPIQFKVASDMVSGNSEGYKLNDFKIDYVNSFKRGENGEYLPEVTQYNDGIYDYDNSKEKWSTLNSKWSTIDGDSSGDVLSEAIKIVPYNGIFVFRITLKDDEDGDSKFKYIIDESLPVAANGVVEKKVISPVEGSDKKEYCSCVQVVVKGNGNSGGIKEDMTGKSGSISIGELKSSSKEVTFKFLSKGKDKDGNEIETELDPSDTHAGNILEKVSVYKIDDSQYNKLSENELYDSRLLYKCTRNDSGKVENTKNSYMLNYKKYKNTIAVRVMQGIDVEKIEGHIMIGGKDVTIEEHRTVDLSTDDNNGYIVIFRIPDEYINAFSPEGIVIEFKGIDIKRYAISLQGFDDVGVEKKLSSESEFKEVTKEDNKMSFTVDYGEDFEIKIIGGAKDSYEGLFNRITLASGALFLKEGTQSGGAALQKNNDGSFTYTFFVYKVKSDSTIEFSNVINKVMLDFESVDGMEFYEYSTDEETPSEGDKKIQGKVSCAYGTKYSFKVKASTGYNLSTFKLKATVEGSEGIEEGSTDFSNMFDVNNADGYKIYTLKNGAQKSTTISGTINKEIKTVTFVMPKKADGDDSLEPVLKYLNEQGDEVSSMDVDYGSNVAFSVSLSEKYSNSSINVELYKKGDETLLETLHTVSGYYKITNITENYEIKVSGCTVNNYFVNFSKNDYVDYLIVENGEDKEMNDNVVISYGGSCYFKVKEKEGYQMGESSVVQATSASGQKITLEKNSLGQYKLSNIKDNYTITVENINDVFYNLKFITVDGVTYYNEVGSAITGDFKVGYGKNFEFSIKIDDAHSESIQGAYIVTNESGQSEVKIQKLASDRYLIQNITQDITIRVANVSKNKYTITLTKDEGIDYYNKDGKVITGENEVEYGGSLSFKVSLYPLYANSNIKVMLGNQELSADDNEFYTVETVTENKTVTVVGIGKTDVAEVIETINSLPTDIKDDTDLEQIIQAVRDYNNLSDAEKSSVGNYYVLEQLQKKVADIIHTYNGVTAEGLDWNIKLIANPIDTDLDACTRIYGKLNSEYILSLYDVYLWDTLTERRYTLPEGKSVVIHLPTPNMTYFENPSGVHENSDGKLNFLTLNMGNSVTSIETSSLSPIGIVADRSIQPGRSSLIDAIDSNVSMLTNYTLGSLSGSGNKKESNYSGNKNNISNSFDEGEALTGGSNSTANKFRKTDNSTTRLGSALKLILIIMILLIIIAIVWALVKKYKDKSKKSKNNHE